MLATNYQKLSLSGVCADCVWKGCGLRDEFIPLIYSFLQRRQECPHFPETSTSRTETVKRNPVHITAVEFAVNTKYCFDFLGKYYGV